MIKCVFGKEFITEAILVGFTNFQAALADLAIGSNCLPLILSPLSFYF